MKTFEEILKEQEPVFLELFNSKESVASYFDENLEDNVNILYAWYEYESYSGAAIVIFEQSEKLYEVNGGHCSCYGLEGQWEPQEIKLNEIENRLRKGTFGELDGIKEQLKNFFGIDD